MSKNNEYVGVDEKFIPESEKRKQYVDESIIGDETRDKIKRKIHDGADYLSSEEGKEKAKNIGRKGLKIAKGVGIGYLVYVGIVVLIALSIFIFAFVMISKGLSQQQRMIDSSNELFNEVKEEQQNVINSFGD